MARNDVRIGVGVPGAKKAASELDQLRDRVEKAKKAGAKGFAIGAGAAITAKGINLAADAASAFVDVMGDAVQAAIEDERSQQKLRTALEANIRGWDGNTDAIERTLKARMKLGFSDDEQRDSLARLVATTHDVNGALKIEATAMDLARFKGISLADASEALIKVNAGNYRALKSLGIVLKEGATAQEALAEVQKVAAGQAEDYAQTTAGKLLVAQTQVNEAMEDFGRTVLPLVAGGLETVSRALDRASISYDEARQAAEKGSEAARFHALAMEATGHGAADAADQLDRSERSINQSTENIGRGFTDMADQVYDATKDVKHDVRSMVDRLTDDAESLVDNFFEPINEQFRIQEARAKLAAATTREETIGALEDEADALVSLGKRGELTANQVETFAKDARREYGHLSKDARAKLQALIDKLRELARVRDVDIAVRVANATGDRGNNAKGGKAGGGSVVGGAAYLVGEQGPEMFVPNSSGSIIPHGSTQSMLGAAGVTNINLTINGRLDTDEAGILRAVKRMRAMAHGGMW